MELKGVDDFAKHTYEALQVEGWGAFKLEEKLKKLKFPLKEWSKYNYGELQKKWDDIKKEIALSDRKVEHGVLTVEEVQAKADLVGNLKQTSTLLESQVYQNARLSCMKEGDSNTRFFNTIVNWRRRKSGIMGVLYSGNVD